MFKTRCQNGTNPGCWLDGGGGLLGTLLYQLHEPSSLAIRSPFNFSRNARVRHPRRETRYDKHVNPAERVTDFRTFVSGVKAKHLKGALSLRQCQKEVAAILKNKFLVGHALSNDLKVYLAFMLFRGLCVVDERGLVGSNKLNIYIYSCMWLHSS